MRDYGRVHSTFWTSQTTGKMSDKAKLLALYLMTCSHNTIAGVFRLPDGYIAEDLPFSKETIRQGFAELFAKGFANRCETTKWVWVCRHLNWNKPENPNQRKAAAKVAISVPWSCQWKPEFIKVCGPLLELFPEQFGNPSETVTETLAKPGTETGAGAGEETGAGKRATALTADWLLPEEWKAWATNERQDLDPNATADRFRDYWIAKPGKDGRKLDWEATWRNWVRNERQGTGTVTPINTGRQVFK